MNTPSSTPNVNPRIHHAVALNLAFGLLMAAVAQAQILRTATAEAMVVNGFVVAVTVTDGGAGYKAAPAVTFSGGGGSGAWAEATVANGAVQTIIVRGAGSGYTSTPDVVIAPPPPPTAPVLQSVRLQSVVTIEAEVGSTNWIFVADVPGPYSWRILTNVVVTNSPYAFVDVGASPLQRYYQVAAVPEAQPVPILVYPFRWAWIPPGQFTMGSSHVDPDRSNSEAPQTLVTLSAGFYIGRYEVTQGEYEMLMGSNPSMFGGDANRPVERVNWQDATNYCGQLTVRERAAGRLPEGWEYRLPTEAQWEYACRAGTTNRFSFGDDPGYTELSRYAWYEVNSGGATHPVGAKSPNPWGLYDMHGNVWEWCLDWYADSLPGGSVTDPQGPASGSYRAFRGGGWERRAEFCRSAGRSWFSYNPGEGYIGFRVALVQIP